MLVVDADSHTCLFMLILRLSGMSGPSTPVHSDHSESTVEGFPPRPGVVPISPPRALTPPPVAGPSRPPGYPHSGQTPIAAIPLRAIPSPAPEMPPPAPIVRPPIRGPPPEHESSGFSGVGPSYPHSPLSVPYHYYQALLMQREELLGQISELTQAMGELDPSRAERQLREEIRAFRTEAVERLCGITAPLGTPGDIIDWARWVLERLDVIGGPDFP
ncbi:protein PAF1 homolog [Daucus carota subsp. sativus]|uniref:protein PAF1 homolog n=1 Tax=Daucus carota subsp. sativus TaxID=79200 RepID=UPI003083C3F4